MKCQLDDKTHKCKALNCYTYDEEVRESLVRLFQRNQVCKVEIGKIVEAEEKQIEEIAEEVDRSEEAASATAARDAKPSDGSGQLAGAAATTKSTVPLPVALIATLPELMPKACKAQKDPANTRKDCPGHQSELHRRALNAFL